MGRPAVAEHGRNEAEELTSAVELLADIRQHLPHRAVFESAELIGQVAQAVAAVADRVDR